MGLNATRLNIPGVLAQAQELCRQGRLAEAERLCAAILAIQPNQVDTLQLLGTIKLSNGRFGEALEVISSAMRCRAPSPQILRNHGLVLNALNRPREAIESFDRAIKLKSRFSDAHNDRGNALTQLKRFDEALASYDRALAVQPNFVEALYNRGNALTQLKRFDEALVSYDRALALRPNLVEALYNRGSLLCELMRFDEALASFDRALALRPDFIEALCSQGHALEQLRRFDEALASYDRALALRPDYAEAVYNRGNALTALTRLDEALASYDRAVALRPDFAEAFSNRGMILHKLKRFDEALASFDRALALRPDLIDTLYNRGVTLFELKRFDEALTSYGRAIAGRPDYADAHFNESFCWLVIGDFDRGWKKYEWRWETGNLLHTRRGFTQPLWLGQGEIAGKTILLHAEQGFGDAIQFCRYAPLVAARGGRVLLEVHKSLQELMNTLDGVADIIPKGDPLPDFDLQCPLLSLPLAFRTRLETIPSAIPYLRVSADASNRWERRLGPRDRCRIGLAWSGSPTNTRDHNRSIGLNSFLSLLDINATFVSLQKDIRAADAMVLNERTDLLHFGNELNNFSDTAALIANLDLVITVDTSVAHLAGSLAKPVWILLPFVPDWRWLLDREDSPWYPTARLFRQDATRAWDNVIARVHAALHDFVQNRP